MSGFTLVEMSVVLLVVGMVILMIFPAMKAIRDGTQRTTTASHMQTLLRSVAAFAQANGCLPCPVPIRDETGGDGFGRVRGEAAGALCSSACTADKAEGIPPFVSLGLPSSVAKDGWGRWITMRIDPELAKNFGVVPPTAPCLPGETVASCTIVGASQKGLCRANLSQTNRISVSVPDGPQNQSAAIVLVSHGPNGFGAYQASPAAGANTSEKPPFGGPVATCGTTKGFEACNADGDRFFVDATETNNPEDPYDDILLYMDRNALIAFLGRGVCETMW